MAQMKLPAAPNIKTTAYGNLRGVNFSVDPSLCEKNRSPMALNMISDNGGNPIKRLGWRVLHKLEGNVNGLFRAELGESTFLIAHVGSKLYQVEATTTELKDGISDTKSCAFYMNDGKDKLFLLTGKEFLSFDGTKVEVVADSAYIPTIIISRLPKGGGTAYEAVNLLSPKRKESFLGDATSKDYQLSATTLDAAEVTVQIANSSGGFDTMKENSGFTVNRTTGKVTFSAVHAPVVAGADNIIIEYAKTVEGYADKVQKCTVSTIYGVGGSNRVFISGNPDFQSYDFWSDIYKPSYFPDLNYAVIGASNTRVMGYQKLGEYLAIIKEANQQDTTIFLRSGVLNEKGAAVFSVKSGVAGIGAISKYCFSTLGDEPLFLSGRGVYGIASTLLSYERVAKNRSYYIDKKLTEEKNLENAVAVEWNGYYIVAINSRCYILDGRHKSGDSKGNSDYLYECYYWENVPATVFLPIGNDLYFGTPDGRICRFNNDIDNMTAYSDGGTAGENGFITGSEPINAAWFTPNDDDGSAIYFKTMQKKGSMVTISPYAKSSAEVCLVVDGNPEEFVKKENMDIFSWENVDFDRYSFNSNTSPQEIYFNKKKKKYKRMQIGIRNRQINEGFGIHEIAKSYTIGNFSKNRG